MEITVEFSESFFWYSQAIQFIQAGVARGHNFPNKGDYACPMIGWRGKVRASDVVPEPILSN